MTKKKILLIGNYAPDRQESMLRFGNLLERGLIAAGIEVKLLQSPARFGGNGPLAKWRGYADKLILFRSRLVSASRAVDVVHICDHSNAMYVPWIKKPVLATCHDLLAVRGALGEIEDCKPSFFGHFLQRKIIAGLKKASLVVCVSRATQQDFQRIIAAGSDAPESMVVPLCLNFSYKRIGADAARAKLAAIDSRLARERYILHVGSAHRRKNREGVLQGFARIDPGVCQWCVFAGEPLSAEQRALAGKLGVQNRIVEISKPENSILEALYNCAHCLLFPSRFEGFGWPILEAQAAGCPVVASTASSLPEVVGIGAILVEVDDFDAMAAAAVELAIPERRSQLVQMGLKNLERFSEEQMIASYIAAYQRLSMPEAH